MKKVPPATRRMALVLTSLLWISGGIMKRRTFLASSALTAAALGTTLTLPTLEAERFQAIIADPAMQAKLKAMGVTPEGSTSEEFQVFIDKETAKWAEVIKAANVPLQ